ncbi:hypothetical protein MEQU1_001129 [Malassezia equina]|uniref:Uncharacterized protein n=1 Tax=Malassezia equina TaxID=1381935 RepID=A0AAF0EHJ0_9BASI|nr:hypothetical protein MEQU1_001129 [Malassezia equina]
MVNSVRLSVGLILAAQLVHAFSVKSGLRPRQYNNQTQIEIEHQAKDDPIGATKKVKKMPNLGTPGYDSFAKHIYGVHWVGEHSSQHQVPWFDNGKFPFTKPDPAERNADGGLTSVPKESNGFVLKDDLKLRGDAVQPYYITKDYNPDDVKRAVIVFPGMPRDAWKWATLMQNAFDYVHTKRKYCYQKKDAIILSPLTLNQQDSAAVQNHNWAIYKDSNWEVGGSTHSPDMPHGESYFTMIDKMIDMLLDKSKFPNLDKVVLAGHSMGAQAVQHYQLMRKTNKDQEDSIMWWIGNPGAWTWLNAGRPTYWPDCQDQMNIWPYGLNQTSKHVAYNMNAKEHKLVSAALKRETQIALGLDDNGEGNTHCEAFYQGANHLDRGSNYVLSVDGMGGLPSNYEVNYVAHVAHQDYPMYAANRSLDFIWGKHFNGDCSAKPPVTTTSTSSSTSTKSSSTSTSTSSSSSTSTKTSSSSTSTSSSKSSAKPTTITTSKSGSTTTVTATPTGAGQDCGNNDSKGGGICISGSGNGNTIQIS